MRGAIEIPAGRKPGVAGDMWGAVSSPPVGQATGYVLVQVDGGTVLLPQQDIESIELAMELVPADGKAPLVGHLAFAGSRWPVVCLDGELSLIHTIPPTRRICLLLKTAEQGFGLLCDSIRPLDKDSIRIQGLKACMVVPGSLLQGLAIVDGRVVSLISVGALSSHLEQRLRREE